MDYQQYIKQTYHIESDIFTETQGAYLMMENGDIHYVEYSGHPSGEYSVFDELVYYYANYCNQNYNSYANMILYYSDYDDGFYLIMRDNVDYVLFNANNTEIYNYSLIVMEEDDTPIEGAYAVSTYMHTDAVNPFTDFSYGTQQATNFSNKQIITDLSNIKASNYYDDYTQQKLVVRGENVTYSKFAVEISRGLFSGFDISYGSPYYDIRQQARQDGYGDGYASGWVLGQQYGYQAGLNSGVNQNANTAFGYIGQAFGAVNTILNIEVLPDITLGLCFAIPFTLAMIMVIFKMVKK